MRYMFIKPPSTLTNMIKFYNLSHCQVGLDELPGIDLQSQLCEKISMAFFSN